MGIRPGDLLVSWRRGRRSGALASPFDFVNMYFTEAPRGPVTLEGRRAGRGITFRMNTAGWGIQTRPSFPETLLSTYEASRRLLEKDRARALSGWEALATRLERDSLPKEALWLRIRILENAPRERSRADGDRAFASARALARSLHDPLAEALALDAHASLRRETGDPGGAAEEFGEALALRRTADHGGFWTAFSLRQLGNLAFERRELRKSDGFYRGALAIYDGLAPGSGNTAMVENQIAMIARSRGDLAACETHERRALAINEKVGPGDWGHALILSNMGQVLQQRGDLSGAEELYLKSFEAYQRLHKSWYPAGPLRALGGLARVRGDLDAAEGYYRRALSILEEEKEEGFVLAGVLDSLGHVALDRGDLSGAAVFFQRSLALREQVSPDNVDVGLSLHALGELALRRGDLPSAQAFLSRALEIRRRHAPRTLFESDILVLLGDVARGQGRLREAIDSYEAALAIRRTLAPGSHLVAEVHDRMGRALLEKGSSREAAEQMRLAISALEEQRGRLGGSDQEKASFETRFQGTYRAAVETLVRLGRVDEAFEVSEKGRARAFLAVLAERDLVFDQHASPELDRSLREIDAERDAVEEQCGTLSVEKDAPTLAKLRARLGALKDRREALVVRLRRAAPRMASLQSPAALSAGRVSRVLDAGTVLLTFSVGPEKTMLFVLTPGAASPEVHELTVSEEALRRDVSVFRALIARAHGSPATDEDALAALGARLYDTLLRPAEKTIATGQRLLVVPDGPLHLLPFAALVRSRRPDRYLVEWRPTHLVLSATLYAQETASRSRPRTEGPVVLQAFGDPVTAPRAERPEAAERGSAVGRARELEPLPGTREEVHRIAALFGPAARERLGREATEENARAIPKSVRYVHFATHSVVDRRFPLDSGLVLSRADDGESGRDNGFLQAWEIFEKVRLDADVVTLSACDTGLGREAGGEGLLSLARAFQFAGARSVVASLWAVSDRSTGDLMVRFYEGLKRGRPKDEALRAAQLDLLRSPATRAPFFWAAFQLHGDWK